MRRSISKFNIVWIKSVRLQKKAIETNLVEKKLLIIEFESVYLNVCDYNITERVIYVNKYLIYVLVNHAIFNNGE
jgi:hypothetical protein